MNGFSHRLDIRVPYAHTDQMGVVYYANYLVYFEMARSELLRARGTPYTEMERQGVLLPVLEAHCEYSRPARYDDLITVHSVCTELRGPRLRIEYRVTRGEETLATGHTVHACMAPDGKVIRPPVALRQLVE